MSGQGRPTSLLVVAFLALSFSSVQRTIGAAPPPPYPAEMAADASLADVFFVDTKHGWAVGDRGVIWHTPDGGEHWYLQESSVGCRLESVWFVDPDNGWVVGGWTNPYTHTTSGVVLWTRNGGRNWTLVERHLLPKLKRVRMRDAHHGMVLGAASTLYPTGVWTTRDGGRTFSPLPGTSDDGWSTGDGSGPQSLALAGDGGRIGFVRQGRWGLSTVSQVGLRNPQCIRINEDGVGILVGDGGLIRATVDGGQQWHLLPEAVPEPIARQFDFQAAAMGRGQIWVAGSPGTYVFHTSDGGRTWRARPTHQSLPIHALCFVDERHGWAVGALGTILASEDSGRTWQRQQSGGSRVAALGLFGSDRTVPWAAIAKISNSQGYLTAVEIIGRTHQQRSPVAEGSCGDRVHEALVMAGASATETCWRFPVHELTRSLPPRDLVDLWNRAAADDAIEHAENRLVRAIRQWRPDVVLTHSVAEQNDRDSLGWVAQQLTLAAVRKAADQAHARDQQVATGLKPWRVRRVFGTMDDSTNADLLLPTTELVPSLGRSLGELATVARSLTEATPVPMPATLAFHRLTGFRPDPAAGSDADASNDFFDGIILQRGGDARRAQARIPMAGMMALRKRVQMRRNMEHILSSVSDTDQTSAARLRQIAHLVRDLDADGAAGLLHQLATQQVNTGHPELAADAFSWLVDRYGDHPLAESALVWLVRYYASGEMRWIIARRSQLLVQQASATTAVPSHKQFVIPVGQTWQPGQGLVDDDGDELPVTNAATADHTAPPPDETYDRARRAIQAASLIRGTRPSLAAGPAVAFPEAAAQRQLHRVVEANRIYQRVVSDRPADVWWSCAQAELGGPTEKRGPSKPVIRIARAKKRPVLDGKLEDDVWATAQMINLVSPPAPEVVPAHRLTNQPESQSGAIVPGAVSPEQSRNRMATVQEDRRERWPATVLLAWDNEYLYLAADCRRSVPATTEPHEGPRPRDPDLSDQDRVDLLIDVDRDYATYFRLTVDQRGFTGESCFGDKTWDPKWYVAAEPDNTVWTIEAAVPLKELVAKPPRPGDAWAIGVQRTIPGAGFQSWSQPATPEVRPEGFGLLVFE